MNYYVYILKCADGNYYTGITNDLERRLEQHEQGINKSCYTFNRRPLELSYKINFTNPEEAIKWEKRIKNWSRKKKEALITENWEDLIKYSKSKKISIELI